MELRHLRYFVAVAEELHFGRAAERLHISQPPLSRQIHELEEEIGFPLFVRGYHKVALTEAGTFYVAEVRHILQQLETAKQQAADVAMGRSGRLRVGHGTPLPDGYLSRVLAAFQHAAPRVTIDLLEAPTPRVLTALRQKSTDLAFVTAPSERAGLVITKLWRDRLMIALPEWHRYATAPLVDLGQLAHENFVLCGHTAESACRDVIEAVCREAGFVPHVQQSVEHKQTALDLVAAGVGISIVQSAVAAIRSNGIRYREFPKAIPFVDTAMAWRDDTQVTALAPFVEIAEREALAFAPSGMMPMEMPLSDESPANGRANLSTAS